MRSIEEYEAGAAVIAPPPKTRAPAKDYRAIARELHDTLKRIARGYMTPEQIRTAIERRREPMYGLQYEEALEMAYENMQADAQQAIEGKRRP